MASELRQAESNKEVVEKRFEAAIQGDREAVAALQHEDYVLELNYGLPTQGTFKGAEEIARARQAMISQLGINGISVVEVLAEGPTRVVAVAEAHGTDATGEPWSMEGVELIDVVDGQITGTRLIFRDSALLRDIAEARAEKGLND